jgi:hypothetical protein
MEKAIKLNLEIYSPIPTVSFRNDSCDHEFPEEKHQDEDDYCSFKCTKCGCIYLFEVWN